MVAALFVAGGMVQAVHTPLFSLAGDLLGTELSSTGAGILDGWLYVGASLAGVGLGHVFDAYSLASGVWLMAGVAAVCALVAVPIQR